MLLRLLWLLCTVILVSGVVCAGILIRAWWRERRRPTSLHFPAAGRPSYYGDAAAPDRQARVLKMNRRPL